MSPAAKTVDGGGGNCRTPLRTSPRTLMPFSTSVLMCGSGLPIRRESFGSRTSVTYFSISNRSLAVAWPRRGNQPPPDQHDTEQLDQRHPQPDRREVEHTERGAPV